MIHVFAGPTIASAAVTDILPQARLHPPARTGDIHAACQHGASAIGLIDGYFDGVPSVWHKEILWALDQGIAVFGAASMGALRAAELHSFGMVGVGAIFEAYRDGTFEDDDEVALRHGPAELGYVALSEPMVNIRATLALATERGQIDGNAAAQLIMRAKALHFPDRTWDTLLGTGDLRVWVREHAVDQKQRDALQMLTDMASDIPKPMATFTFQHTVMWEGLVRAAGPDRHTTLILDQLRHDPEAYVDLRRRAVATLAADTSWEVSQAEVHRAVTRFRAERQLYTAQALNDWLEAHKTDLNALHYRCAEDIGLTDVIAQHRDAFDVALVDLLQSDGTLAGLRRRARHMAATLDTLGHPNPAPDSLDLQPGALLQWYFETVTHRPVPDDLDAYIKTSDFADRDAFEQMMARTYLLWHHKDGGHNA
ncbi:TfuA-like protein [uncultured Tateyamaria sp.]|uniref:TfuA-like protein n=1 Tax=Tateyamaria sp. 1078 TaxID=3417464 RepID=UPI002639B4E6|nr:TfuA-like protein [uncultured Tateyamaria sp.]